MALRWITSSRKTPCPVCGRIKDTDCRFNDETILCHQGSSSAPPRLSPGETLEIEGKKWNFVKYDAGFAHSAALFKPKTEDAYAERTHYRKSKTNLTNKTKEAQLYVDHFHELARQALDVTEFKFSTLDEFNRDAQLIDDAIQYGEIVLELIKPLKSEDEDLRLSHEEIETTMKALNYQQSDANQFSLFCLGYDRVKQQPPASVRRISKS